MNVQTGSRISRKASQFNESVIREMTRQAALHNAINLAQGFPDFPAPMELKRAAQQAIENDINQYAITWGARDLREAIAAKCAEWQGLTVDPETEITVCCGATEAMVAALLATVDPGDEVILFEPWYENYGADAILCGATPRYVPLRPPDGPEGEWHFDPTELRAAFHRNTRAIIINTPNNPTGKVFSRAELELIRDLCVEHDALAITDEIYEHILYDGAEHVAPATIEGMASRTITINGMSKTYSVTGWRVGWTIAPADLTLAIRKVHDFLTVGAAAPLQAAGAVALGLPRSYYRQMAESYQARRDQLMAALRGAGLVAYRPQGAYYIMTDVGSLGFRDDLEFTRYLVEKIGVAAVPGSSFYSNGLGAQQARFAFCKRPETLTAATERLNRLRAR
jgi:aspartate/methionine/tyrosine aminotransferase